MQNVYAIILLNLCKKKKKEPNVEKHFEETVHK